MCVMLLQATHPLQQQKPSLPLLMQMLEPNAVMESVLKTSLLPLCRVCHPAQSWHGVPFSLQSSVIVLYMGVEEPKGGKVLFAAYRWVNRGSLRSWGQPRLTYYKLAECNTPALDSILSFTSAIIIIKKKSQKSIQWVDKIEPAAAAVTTSPAGDEIKVGMWLNAIAHSRSSSGPVVLNMKLVVVVFFFFFFTTNGRTGETESCFSFSDGVKSSHQAEGREVLSDFRWVGLTMPAWKGPASKTNLIVLKSGSLMAVYTHQLYCVCLGVKRENVPNVKLSLSHNWGDLLNLKC